jgi:two-component system, OmpR family, alkaline phosphatase synthesis response regulator PhoP
MAHILVVEDHREIAAALHYNLELEGHRVTVAHDGAGGLQAARDAAPDLLILDLMLPGMSGYEVLETLRREGFRAPVLILTARGEEADKVRGFRAGADQYMVKPFGLLELLERVKLLLRRWSQDESAQPLRVSVDVELDLGARVVRRRGREVPLSPKAFDLLLALARRGGRTATRLELLREVWGHRGAVMTRTVDSHIADLRRKLEEDPADPQFIVTVWKVGYRIRA